MFLRITTTIMLIFGVSNVFAEARTPLRYELAPIPKALLNSEDAGTRQTSFRAASDESDSSEIGMLPPPLPAGAADPRSIPSVLKTDEISSVSETPPIEMQKPNVSETPVRDALTVRLEQIEAKLNQAKETGTIPLAILPEIKEKNVQQYPDWASSTLFIFAVSASGAFVYAFFTAIDYRRRWLESLGSQNTRLTTLYDPGDEFLLTNNWRMEASGWR